MMVAVARVYCLDLAAWTLIHLEAGGAPVHELDGPLAHDGGDGREILPGPGS